MYAQSTMDEQFSNGPKFPYGWFGEGWKMKTVDDDGVVESEATENSGGFMPGGGGGMPSFNPDENPGGGGMPGMGGMFGGPHVMTYLLTPPLDVKNNEKIVLRAKKVKAEGGFNFDMKAIMGFSDTIVVVERSVYGKNQWLRVADLTHAISDDYQDFTIEGTPAGKYRFRIKSYINADITEAKGGTIDKEAPDLLVTVDSLHTRFVDYSVCDKDSTKTYIVINTGTGTLKVNIASENSKLFSVNKSSLEIAAGDSAEVDVTFHYAAGKIGKNDAKITFTPTDTRVNPSTITAAAVITDPDAWFVDFNDNKLPLGCYGEGFVVKEGVATHYDPNGGGMAAIFGGGGASTYFLLPPFDVKSDCDALVFSFKNGDGSYKGPIIDAKASVTLEKTIYGSNKWEKVTDYELTDTLYHTKWISYLEPGKYRFRFVSGDSLCIDSVAGFRIDMNAPDLLVKYNGKTTQLVNYGIARADQTRTFQLINTGTSELQLYAMSSDPNYFTLSQQMFTIPAGETQTLDVTYHHNAEALGAHQAALILSPTNCQISMQMVYLAAYTTYEDAWTEDFEPEFEIEEGEECPLPEDWTTTGWEVTKGGGMDMMAMMGMGGGAEKTWAPHTDSDAYELISPKLQAQKGDVLRFYADISSGYLSLYYRRTTDADWTYDNTYIVADSLFFIAPYTGIYEMKFVGSSVSVDDFIGFRTPAQEVALLEGKDDENAAVLNDNKGKRVNVTYDRVLTAQNDGYGSWTPTAYTICLPYEYRFGNILEPGNVKFYQLSYIDQHYRQFIFTDISDVAEAGQSYLVVVERGIANLNAYDVELLTQPLDGTDERTSVNDFEDMYFEEKATKVGEWLGTFRTISAAEADQKEMYCVREDGTWARFQSGPTEGENKLDAFRGYFLVTAEKSNAAFPAVRTPKAPKDGSYNTMFQKKGSTNVEASNGIIFHPDIPMPTPTGIKELEGYTIQTIEADGSSRYFDLQGRMLDGKPAQKSIFIKDGKKYAK